MQFSLHRVPITGAAAARVNGRRQARRATIDIAHQALCERILDGELVMADVDRTRVDLVRLQDDIAQIGQGRLADRSAERLGRADVGVVLTRRLWRRELAALLNGEPLKHWTRDDSIAPKAWGLGVRRSRPGSDRRRRPPGDRPTCARSSKSREQLRALRGAARTRTP